MSTKQYSVADHQRAFEIWYETENLTRAAEVIGCEYTTIRMWMLDTYRCKYSCPWHGWERIQRERKAALNARFQLIEQGNVDPVAHSQAMMDAVEKEPNPDAPKDSLSRRKAAIETIIRSDLERISHFELLYGKIFQQATGLAVDHGGIHGIPEGGERYQSLQALYNMSTLKCTSLDSAIKSLIQLTDYIKKLKEDMGITKRLDAPVGTRIEEIDAPAAEEAPKELTIEELRQFRELCEHTAPDKIELLKKIMRADDAQVRQVLGDSPEPVKVPVAIPASSGVYEASPLPPPPPFVPSSGSVTS